MDNEKKPIYDGENKKHHNGGHHHRRRKKKPSQPRTESEAVKIEKEEVVIPDTHSEHNSDTAASGKNKKNRRRRGKKHKSIDTVPASTEEKLAANAHEEYDDIDPSSIADESIYDTPTMQKKTPSEDEKCVEIIGIRFKAGGKTYYFEPNGIVAPRGAYAIVETARGLEYGEVATPNSMVPESETVPPLRPVIRLATDADKKHHAENKEKEQNAFHICNEKILAHGLDMKLIDSQYTFDNSKLLFYFTSSGRVDFRELVKDLASVFKTRIELRQIGIRDEAKLIGGLGICGRPLCCAVFLSDFGQVSIKMAKEQNLSLNSAKISGACGRLMCCLRYEHEVYAEEIKLTPPVDSKVKTPDGIGTVTEISPLVGKIKVRLDDKPDQQPRPFHRDEVTVIGRAKAPQDEE